MSNKGAALAAVGAGVIAAPEETAGLVQTAASGLTGVVDYTARAANDTFGMDVGSMAPFAQPAMEAFGGASMGDYVSEKFGITNRVGKGAMMVGGGLLALSNPTVGLAASIVTGYKGIKFIGGAGAKGAKWIWNKGASNDS